MGLNAHMGRYDDVGDIRYTRSGDRGDRGDNMRAPR